MYLPELLSLTADVKDISMGVTPPVVALVRVPPLTIILSSGTRFTYHNILHANGDAPLIRP